MPHEMNDRDDASTAPAAHDSPSAVNWEELYDEIGERVFRLLHRMVRDAEEAADLTHDAFLRMHQARDQYDQHGPLHAWAFRIAANLGRDALRRRGTRQKYLQPEAGDEPTSSASRRRDVERLSLQRALTQLSPTHRTVLLLHDVDGYTHLEIGEMLAIPVGTSKARLSRARSAMRSVLSEPPRQSDRPPGPEPAEGPTAAKFTRRKA